MNENVYGIVNPDTIYEFQNGSYIKPIKLVYENHAKVTWDKDSGIGTISIKLPNSNNFLFDDCGISLYNDLEKYFDIDKNDKNNRSDTSHFKSLL